MKRVIEESAVIFTAAVFMMISALTAFAISVDGYCSNIEWKEAEVFNLAEQKKLSNSVKSAVVKAQNSKTDGCVYMLIMAEFEKNGSLEDGCVRLRVNDGETAEISAYGDIISDGGYEIEAASECDEYSGCVMIETAIHFKDDITPSDEFRLNFVDLIGEESGTYTIRFTEEETEPEDAENNSKTEKSKTSKTSKTKSLKKTSSKTKKTKTTDDFTFKKVDKSSVEPSATAKSGKADDIQSLTAMEISSEQSDGEKRKYAYAAAGTVCALGVAVAAVVCAAKSNENKNKKD